MFEIIKIIRESFAHHVVFSAGALLIVGYFLGQLCERVKLPTITGYIIAGIIIGESGLNFLHARNSEILHTISEITLSFIAVVIGGEFSFYKLKLYGKKIIFLTAFQMFATFIFVAIGLILLGLPLYASFILGAIAAATAPAATVVIVEKLKAKGKFVDYLYGIVALDDAGTVILFSIAFALSSGMISGKKISFTHSLTHAFLEIFISIFIGLISGFLIHLFTKNKKNYNEIKIISIGVLFLSTSISISLNLSPLIANMTIGMVLINLSKKNIRILTSLEPITPPLYAIFFAIAGSELNLKIFANLELLLIGFSFILLRFLGKYFGVFFASSIMKTDTDVKKYLGLSLLPQAGVAIGLILFVQASPIVQSSSPIIQETIVKMINIVLISVFVNELIGPPLTKFAVQKSLKRR